MAKNKTDWWNEMFMSIPIFIIAIVLSATFAKINALATGNPWAIIGITIAVIIGSIMLYPKAKFDDKSFARAIISIGILSVYGTLITLAMPSWSSAISPFIITLTGSFSAISLLYIGFYYMVGETIIGWFK